MSVVADGLGFVTSAALATALYIDFLPLWFVIVSQAFGVFFDGPGTIGGVVFAPRVSQHRWLVRSIVGHAFALAGLFLLQPGSLLSFAAGFTVDVMTAGIMSIPYAAFYTRIPARLLGRVNCLGAASGFLAVSISSPFFGWLVHVHSARTAILACAIGMGLLSIGTLLFLFMKLLDQKQSPDFVKEKGSKGA